jgi:signal transduction histidine kinase
MTTWQVNDVLDGAVQTLINERCRRAYIHDMRGSLQAIYTSFEVLARSARNDLQNNVTLIDRASSLAKRAVERHEQALTDIVDQVTGPEGAAEVVNVPQLVQQAVQFLRNDAQAKDITLRLSGCDDALVLTQRNKLRSLILGLLALGIDALPSGAELHVDLSRSDSFALLELRSEVTYGAIREAEELLCHDPINLQPQELVLTFARNWITAKGGRVELPSPLIAQSGLRIYYPLAAA